jgi:hypothetical protein
MSPALHFWHTTGCPMFVGGYREKPQLRGVLKEGGNGPNAVYFGAHTDFRKSPVCERP